MSRSCSASRTGAVYPLGTQAVSDSEHRIRPCRPEDTPDLYQICLATGENGADASDLYADPQLIGHIYAGPYPRFSPETCYVVEDQDGVGGYILGALDTAKFEATLEAAWWPLLRARYADPPRATRGSWTRDDWRAWQIHHPVPTPAALTGDYPSHLHIDLLPRLQGVGLGRRLMDTWLARLRQLGSVGAHLGVGRGNPRAMRFYRAYGWNAFDPGDAKDTATAWFAMKL